MVNKKAADSLKWFVSVAVGALLVLVLVANAILLPAAPVFADTYTYTTSGTWIAPTGVTSVTVEVWGGGGRGGRLTAAGRGGGGGGGGYSIKTIAVTPGNSYSYTVGLGSTTTAAGGDSYFIDALTLLAKGGNSCADNSATGASGGAAASGVGDNKYSGGTGVTGAGNYGGGGGSSAGTGADGNTGSTYFGGTAPTGGGNGGNGRSVSNGAGSAGSIPGGGGGGAYRTTTGTSGGGSGANGQVRITYKYNTTTTVISSLNPSTYGDSVTFTATVTRSAGTTTPSGTVQFKDGGSNLGSPVTLSGSGASATADYTTSSLSAGSHTITADYSGDSKFAVSSGTLSDGQTVNYPAPTTTSIDPTNRNVGDSEFTLTVYGTNFVSGASVVHLDGSDRTTNFVSATQLTATTPASDLLTAGSKSITVFNPTPGGGISNAQTLTIIESTFIEISAPSNISSWNLNIGSNSNSSGRLTVNVSSGTNWHVTANDSNSSTQGRMTLWNGSAYNPLVKLFYAMNVSWGSNEFTLPSGGTIIPLRTGNFSDFITFKQEVDWVDEPGTYQIVVTFTAWPE